MKSRAVVRAKPFPSKHSVLDLPGTPNIARYIVADNGCWEWQGSLNPQGYAQIRVSRKLLSAHRVSYELHRGRIPQGSVLDHLCCNPACINPDHLEAVTQLENVRRGLRRNPREYVLKTHCIHGHAYSPENTSIVGGRRVCLPCHREKQRRYLARRAEAQVAS